MNLENDGRQNSRGTQKQPFTDVFEIGAPKNFATFTEKHLCWSLFLTKLLAWGPATLLKTDCNTGVFLWILQKFQEKLFYRTPSVAAFSYSN